MFGLSLGHLVILLVIVLLFRARHLPELAQSIGKSITLFRRGLKGEDLPASPPKKARIGAQDPDAVLPSEKGDRDSAGRS